MTSIDRAFRKAYAKRVSTAHQSGKSDETATPQEKPVWVDEESGNSHRAEVAHTKLPTPHLNRNEHGDRQPVTTAGNHPNSHLAGSLNDDPSQSNSAVHDGTTAYDAWTEKLDSLELESESPANTPPLAPFVPGWEVDRFVIPTVTEKMIADYIGPIGTQLERASREGLQTLAVSSQKRLTGKSSIAIAIAQLAAATGLRVVLVDADIDNPSLMDKLQLEIESDWIDVLSRQQTIDEATIQSLRDKFCFVPMSAKAPELLSGVDQHAALLTQSLRHHFDLIVLDIGPLSGNTFGLAFPLNGDLVDAVIMVENMQQTDLDSLTSITRRIRAVGIDNVGLIENFVAESKPTVQRPSN